MTASNYVFGDRSQEQRRLERQAETFNPLTERVFRAAGIGSGMRVLDLGSGAGDVALLAAELVGPAGEVVGVDRDPAAVGTAQERVSRAGAANVHFRQGDLQQLDGLEGTFDAVVGRLVLMYTPDPGAVLAAAAGHLRPGGIVCMHEGDMSYEWAAPMTPLWTQIRGWFLQTLETVHVAPRMALSLPRAFADAGLPVPELCLESALGGGDDAPTWAWANVVNGVVPVMEKLGIATAADVDPATLADRLLVELRAVGGIVIGPPLVGAWARTPE